MAQRAWKWRSAMAAIAGASAIGFGFGGVSGAATIPLANPFGYKYGYSAAVAELSHLYAGTYTPVNPTKRPAAKDKSIVVISGGQASISSSIPSDAAVAAAQAIALGAQGIVLDAIDCNEAIGPLQEAKAHHIVVVGIDAYDCNDPTEKAGPPLFSATVNYDNIPEKDLGYFAEAYGRGQADYIIAKSHDKARILYLNDPEATILKYEQAGFDDQIAHSGGAKVVDTLTFLSADLGPKLQEEIQAALLRYPDINWIKSPYTYATVLGVVPANVFETRSTSRTGSCAPGGFPACSSRGLGTGEGIEPDALTAPNAS